MDSFFSRPSEAATFDGNRSRKVDLRQGDQLFVGLNCFEPGQTQPVHTHGGADKFYFLLSGKARMTVGNERRVATTGDLVWAPADVPHGVDEVLERTVMLVTIAPPPSRHR